MYYDGGQATVFDVSSGGLTVSGSVLGARKKAELFARLLDAS